MMHMYYHMITMMEKTTFVRDKVTAHKDHKKHISPNDIGVDATNVGSKDRKIKRTSD